MEGAVLIPLINVMRGLGNATLTMLVACMLMEGRKEGIPLAVLAGLFVTIVLTALMIILPKALSFIIILLIPLGEAILANAILKGNGTMEEDKESAPVKGEVRDLLPFIISVAIMIIFFNSANSISKSIHRYSEISADPLALIITGVLIALVLYISCRSYQRFSTVSLYRTVFLFTMLCFLASPIVGKNPSAANSMIACSMATLRAFIFICEFLFCKKTGLSPLVVFSIGEMIRRVPNFICYFIVPEFQISSIMQNENSTLYLSLFLVPAMVSLLIYVLVCTESEFRIFEEEPDEENDLDQTLQRRIAIAEAHNLTRRETEVFMLLAQGKSRPRIADELFLAPGTVDVHVKKIYSKLGVHNRQELLDLTSPDK